MMLLLVLLVSLVVEKNTSGVHNSQKAQYFPKEVGKRKHKNFGKTFEKKKSGGEGEEKEKEEKNNNLEKDGGERVGKWKK